MGSILIDELQGVVSHQITPQGDTAWHLQLKMFGSECAIIHPDLICLSDFHMFLHLVFSAKETVSYQLAMFPMLAQ